ncbi:hypothetical protein Y1Q_0009872 [Alligator mississippiensis]|uniref:Uncharacterized protein n=1 Tax=Alligator mississippiensis TaxID=8496 RepID=A0A151MXC1_ALLMI|nr:hypothetical protein Y1Q_0009872 [Alligator mississippiensis]
MGKCRSRTTSRSSSSGSIATNVRWGKASNSRYSRGAGGAATLHVLATGLEATSVQASKDIDVMLFFFYLFEKRLQRGHARRGWKAVEVFKYLNCGEASGVAGLHRL